MRSRAVLLALVTAALVLAGGDEGFAAAGKLPPRAVVESASADWIIVHDTRSAKPITRGASGGAFEATTLSGGACELSPKNQPPWRPGTPISVVGDSYLQPVPDHGGSYSMRVHAQQECDRFTDSTPGLPLGETLLTAAPGGYTTDTIASDHTSHLTWYQTAGQTTTFDPPFPATTPWTAIGGDAGIVAFTLSTKATTTSSRVRFMPWKQPGSWTTIFTAAPHTALGCTPPSATHVTCTVQGRGPGLLALDGHSRTWLYASHPHACRHIQLTTNRAALVALETSNAGVCTAGKLYQLNADGTLIGGSSRRLYSVPAGIHSGLGGILVSTSNQHYVMRLKSVTDTGTIAWPAQGY